MCSLRARFLRKFSAAAGAAGLSFSMVFIGVPVSAADTFDDDGGSSFTYDDSGSNDAGGYDDSYNQSADGGSYEDSGSEFDYSGAGFDDLGPGDEEPVETPDGEPNGTAEPEYPQDGPKSSEQVDPTSDDPTSEDPNPGPGGQGDPSGGVTPTSLDPGPDPNGDDGPVIHDPPDPTATEPTAAVPTPTVPNRDITTASQTKSVQTMSQTMTSTQITQYSQSIKTTFSKGNYSNGGSRLRSPVSRWNSDWTGYDHFYRPVFTNPYQQPMMVMYRADGEQQVLTVPPLQKAVLSTRMKPGVYSFTSMVGPENGPPTAISVGSFSGGGYKPRPGQEDPPKPPVQTSIKNPWVQVKFNQGVSQPFQVSSLTDLGKDPSVNNATRVLLDGEIPAWGEWSKTDSGEALFVITETQLLPGVKPPAQEPLPGYNVKLVSSTGKPPSSGESTDVFLIVAAAAAGLLALGVIGVFVLKRRKSNDEAPTASIDANS